MMVFKGFLSKRDQHFGLLLNGKGDKILSRGNNFFAPTIKSLIICRQESTPCRNYNTALNEMGQGIRVRHIFTPYITKLLTCNSFDTCIIWYECQRRKRKGRDETRNSHMDQSTRSFQRDASFGARCAASM